MVGGMRRGGAEGGGPLDDRLYWPGDVGGPRWSVGGRQFSRTNN